MLSFDFEPKETVDTISTLPFEIGNPKTVYSDKNIIIIDDFVINCKHLCEWIDSEKENIHLEWSEYKHKFAKQWETNLFDCIAPPNTIVNPCWRFVRLASGQHLSPHVDARYVQSVDRYSIYTIIIYLNTTNGDLEINGKRIQTKAGRVVIFNQDLVHQGRPHSENKYFMRSEFMYIRTPKIETQKDKEANQLLREARNQYYNNPSLSVELENQAFQLSPEIEKLLF
jgi:hypothetical protein